jgi:hypothetical protein
LGTLAIYYGQTALELMRTQGTVIGIWLAGLIGVAAGVWILYTRRRRRLEARA